MRKCEPKPIKVKCFLLRMDAKRTGGVETREVYSVFVVWVVPLPMSLISTLASGTTAPTRIGYDTRQSASGRRLRIQFIGQKRNEQKD